MKFIHPIVHKSALAVDAVEVFLKLKALGHRAFIFETIDKNAKWSFIGFGGTDTLTVKNSDDISIVERKIAAKTSTFDPNLPPFTSGWVGYINYDFVKYQVPKLYQKLQSSNQKMPKYDLDLVYFDRVIAINHKVNEVLIIGNVETEIAHAKIGSKCDELPELDIIEVQKITTELQALDADLLRTKTVVLPDLSVDLASKTQKFSKDDFIDMVKKVQHFIFEGDIFQAVISNFVEYEAKGSLFSVYQHLKKTNASPYMFYMASDDLEIAGAAPETQLSLQSKGDVREVSTFPLAGTRPRGKNETEDIALENELLRDEKERAEHNMLVDLGRNDIGKICEIGSVEVEDYMKIHRYSHVMHIGSKVKGVLKKDVSALEAISGILPAGTLSGAPKIRAMEIINDLEQAPRDVYGGCVGYIATNGNTDMCIAIRTAIMRKTAEKSVVTVRAGAGIVMDSKPASEYEEIENKMKAVLNAVER